MAFIRFLIADDHDIFRRGLRLTIEENPMWKVVAEARDGTKATKSAQEFKPDVAILDLTMPKLNGLEAGRRILKDLPHTKVLILTVHDSDFLTQEMRRSGIHGYVRKAESTRDLIPAIKAALNDATFYPSALAAADRESLKGRRKSQPRLTRRHQEILEFLAHGVPNEKIAEQFEISVKTVETHRRNILLRTNCHSTADLVRYAIRNGIVEP